ncbi:MAG: amino acid transporter [Candidatus Melainabacteria bacterium]|nr:MAG: amino acid transporter [Candidatus Melainabacteria bacterium]
MHETPRRTEQQPEQASWWRVMCLTGVDYFSSLGYVPGIAFLAAGLLSPIATIILVMLTLFGLLPVYNEVAEQSPHGRGSISMLERLLPGWKGKLLVLCLLGFAATDFIITITLSAADAATHLAQNPWMPFKDTMILTLFMLLLLGAIFLKGFREAIGVSVVLVVAYLFLNGIVISRSIFELVTNFPAVDNWTNALFTTHGSVWRMVGWSCLLFPKLALGMSGFETGVAVMPLVRGDANDDPEYPKERIHNTKKLLRTAALIMCVFLIGSAFSTTILIPSSKFVPGGEADGRALAYLAHQYLGPYFGTVYDVSTLLILWFAGASAMTGLLNLVPRYLPRYGMAPDWARARRPLVTFFTAVGFAVTFLFNASVDAQGAAYATGVLALMTSAAFASVLTVWKAGRWTRVYFVFITLVFIYTTIANTIERPDGIKIASFFIAVILTVSLVSRIVRSTELRVQTVVLDEEADKFVGDASRGTIRFVAHRPGNTDYAAKAQEAHETHNIPAEEIIFLEVKISDASDFGDEVLEVTGEHSGNYRILKCQSPAVPNAIAALLLFVRDKTGKIPQIYLGWTEGNPIVYILKYLFLGEGETAPVTREILREAEPNPNKRPKVHVG